MKLQQAILTLIMTAALLITASPSGTAITLVGQSVPGNAVVVDVASCTGLAVFAYEVDLAGFPVDFVGKPANGEGGENGFFVLIAPDVFGDWFYAVRGEVNAGNCVASATATCNIGGVLYDAEQLAASVAQGQTPPEEAPGRLAAIVSPCVPE